MHAISIISLCAACIHARRVSWRFKEAHPTFRVGAPSSKDSVANSDLVATGVSSAASGSGWIELGQVLLSIHPLQIQGQALSQGQAPKDKPSARTGPCHGFPWDYSSGFCAREHLGARQRHITMASDVLESTASVKKVAIVGAGPGGLSLAKALESLGTGVEEISIFERRVDEQAGLGGGLQLSGGAAVLGKLGLAKELKKIANPLRRIVSRTVGMDTLLKLDIPEAIRRRDEAREQLTSNDDTLVYAVMRDALQVVLKDSLKKARLTFAKDLAEIKNVNGKTNLFFTDGSKAGGFDLVIAADGIGAKSLKAVGGSGQRVYSGKRIQFGVVSHTRRPETQQNEFHQWFSEGVYGLVASYGGREDSTSDMVALVFRGGEVNENVDWDDADSIKEDCLQRLDAAGMPNEIKTLAQEADRFFELGVYFHLPRWTWRVGGGRVVLMGDAAHAMPPFLGQGANQAIQDALCIAQKIKDVNEGRHDLDDALKRYEEIRKPPTVELLAKSAFLGELETLPGNLSRLRDAFFVITGKLGIAERVFVDGTLPRTS